MVKRLLLLSLLFAGSAFALDSVIILPLDGPIGSAKISPANGSATAYRMDFPGQKAICFQNITSVDVYLGSSTVSNTNGYPLLDQGSVLCGDLKGGTTVYFYGAGASADIRAFFAR